MVDRYKKWSMLKLVHDRFGSIGICANRGLLILPTTPNVLTGNTYSKFTDRNACSVCLSPTSTHMNTPTPIVSQILFIEILGCG
ncbi:hypothetical protein FKM82_021391 [Ascaphus truei]